MPDNLSPEIIRLLLVLAATIVAHFIARRVLHHAEKVASHTENIWDDSLVAAARKPLPVLIWLSGIFFALHLIHKQTGEQLLEYVVHVQTVSVIACIAWFLFTLIRQVADNLVATHTQAGEPFDRTTIDGLSKLSRVTVLLIAVLVSLQTLGFSVSGVLAFGGVGGIAVGFAARDLLANFFGGLMVHLDRPFNVGEKIRSPEKAIEGIVEYIGWRHTRIRSVNKTVLYVPNSVFTSIVVENPSRMSHRRIQAIIGLRYEDIARIDAITADVRAMLANHAEIDTSQKVIVALDELADSALNLTLSAFTTTTELASFHQTKQEILLAIAAIIALHGAETAFPTRTLHMANA